MKYNPFKPGSIIHPGMFSGRKKEIEIIEKSLFQAKYGNSQNFLIQGERGIGKSSLMLYARALADGALNKDHSEKYKFAIIKVDLEPRHDSFLNIIGKLISETEIEINKREVFSHVKDLIANIQSSYISIRERKTPNHMLIPHIANLFKKIGQRKEIDGICVLIDDVDKPKGKADLGAFFKLLTERLATIESNNVCFGISGLPETINRLRQSHESSLRIFHILNLQPLTLEDSKTVIDLGMKEANAKNKRQIIIKKLAKDLIVELAEGYPYFLQQFCYSSFEVDQDDIIDEKDVRKGIYDENEGALKQLGEKLFNNMFYDKIDSNDYRKVLQYMARQSDVWVTRSDIVKNSQIKTSTINNALRALKERQIIIDHPNQKGSYRLPSRAFAVWVNIWTKNGMR